METLLTTEVTEDQIDHLGHMNVMYYAQHAQAGARTLASRIGLDADGTLFQPDRYTRHHREQLLGSRLEVRGGVLEVGDDQVRVYEELVNTEADVLAASFILTLEATDPEGASRLPLSDPTRSAAGQLVVELPERGRPRTLTIDDDPISNAPSLEELNERGAAMREPRVVHPEECDPDGRVRWGIVADLVWGGTPVRGRDFQPFSEGPGGMKIGWATMETRATWGTRARMGDRLQSFGVETDLADKTLTSRHWVYDLATGSLVCTFSVLSIAFDMAQRRAVSIPDHVRELMSVHLHADLDGMTSD